MPVHRPDREEFDLVVSFNALHWVHDQDAALRLDPRRAQTGWPSASAWCRGAIERLRNTVLEEVRQSPLRGYFPNFKPPHAHFTASQYREMADTQRLSRRSHRGRGAALGFQDQ